MFKKLKGLFIIEEEGTPRKAAQKTNAGQPEDPVQSKEARVVEPVAVAQKGEVTDKFLKVLLGAMDSNNLDGFDYLEFKRFLKSLGEVHADDEHTIFQSAYATAQTMGATVPVLVESAEHYLELLAGERKKFGEAVEKQRSRMLDKRSMDIKKLEQEIADKGKQIDKLKKEIANNKKRVASEKEKKANAEAKIGKTTNDFLETYETLVGQIRGDIEKIKSYLS